MDPYGPISSGSEDELRQSMQSRGYLVVRPYPSLSEVADVALVGSTMNSCAPCLLMFFAGGARAVTRRTRGIANRRSDPTNSVASMI